MTDETTIIVNGIEYEMFLEHHPLENFVYDVILKDRSTPNGKIYKIRKAIQTHQFLDYMPSKKNLLKSFRNQIEEHLNIPGKWEANAKEIV